LPINERVLSDESNNFLIGLHSLLQVLLCELFSPGEEIIVWLRDRLLVLAPCIAPFLHLTISFGLFTIVPILNFLRIDVGE